MLASAQSRVALAAFVLVAAGHRSFPLGAPLPSATSWPGLGTGHWALGTGRLCAWAVWTAQYTSLWPLQGWILQVRTQKGGRQSGIAHAEIWGSGFPYVPAVAIPGARPTSVQHRLRIDYNQAQLLPQF